MTIALLLDEMHAPLVAAALRELGHDVIAVADHLDLRAMPDEELFTWAGQVGRRIVTENVKDFAPLLRRAEGSGRLETSLLFTSSRTFPRSRRNPAPIIDALDAWLRNDTAEGRPMEDWLALAPPTRLDGPSSGRAAGH